MPSSAQVTRTHGYFVVCPEGNNNQWSKRRLGPWAEASGFNHLSLSPHLRGEDDTAVSGRREGTVARVCDTLSPERGRVTHQG